MKRKSGINSAAHKFDSPQTWICNISPWAYTPLSWELQALQHACFPHRTWTLPAQKWNLYTGSYLRCLKQKFAVIAISGMVQRIGRICWFWRNGVPRAVVRRRRCQSSETKQEAKIVLRGTSGKCLLWLLILTLHIRSLGKGLLQLIFMQDFLKGLYFGLLLPHHWREENIDATFQYLKWAYEKDEGRLFRRAC